MARREAASAERKARDALFTAIVKFVVNPKRECQDCRAELGITHRRSILCPACAKIRERRSPSRRADKAYRKALERGKVAGSERFDPIEVLSRDGWRCHICGVATPKRLRGSNHERAPELDHIIPLARGGEHSRKNTACACRKCNGAKGDRPLGQLRLVA